MSERIAILAFVWFLILFEFVCYMRYFALYMWDIYPIFTAFSLPVFVTSVSLICICYYKAITTNPGSPSLDINLHYGDLKEIIQRSKEEETAKKAARRNPEAHPQFDEIECLKKVGYCFKCQKVKEVRVHHCRICKTCILRMDHHCPWVGNCVGLYNHKYFIQFLFYATVSLLFVSGCILGDYFAGKAIASHVTDDTESILLYVCGLSSLILALSIGFLFVTQMFTLSKNLTTLQSYVSGIEIVKPWNKSSLKANLQEIFGQSSWVLPTRPFRFDQSFGAIEI